MILASIDNLFLDQLFEIDGCKMVMFLIILLFIFLFSITVDPFVFTTITIIIIFDAKLSQIWLMGGPSASLGGSL